MRWLALPRYPLRPPAGQSAPGARCGQQNCSRSDCRGRSMIVPPGIPGPPAAIGVFRTHRPRPRQPAQRLRTLRRLNKASATMTSTTRMVHNMVRLRPLLVSNEGIRGPGVASHPNPVADAVGPPTRVPPTSPAVWARLSTASVRFACPLRDPPQKGPHLSLGGSMTEGRDWTIAKGRHQYHIRSRKRPLATVWVHRGRSSSCRDESASWRSEGAPD
jgi:hypothetical protein